jgi:alpha-N-arabinofuranosidase
MADWGTPLTATVVIDRARGTRGWNRDLFGIGIDQYPGEVQSGMMLPRSPLYTRTEFRRDVIDALRELNPTLVRWPGAHYAADYHWRDGVGPHRTTAYNVAAEATDPHAFGTDEFAAWCREVGAEMAISVNPGTGTLQAAAEWVEYCNGTLPTRNARARHLNGSAAPFAVRHWALSGTGWMGLSGRGAAWAQRASLYASVLKRSDPAIEVSVTAPDADALRELVMAAPDVVDLIGLPGDTLALAATDSPVGYRASILAAEAPEREIEALRRDLAASAAPETMGIALDAWATRRADGASVTMADALHAAGVLNAALRHADIVRAAVFAPAINGAGLLLVHDKGVIRRPTFHVLALYAEAVLPRLIELIVRSDRFGPAGRDVAAFDGAASCSTSGEDLSLILCNRDPERNLRLEVVLDGARLEGVFDARILAGDSPDAFNALDHPERVKPLKMWLTFRDGVAELPAHAILAIRLQVPALPGPRDEPPRT